MPKNIKQILLAVTVIGVVVVGDTVSAVDSSCGTETAVLKCDSGGGDPLLSILTTIINVMSAGVGAIAVGGMIYAAILYTSSGASPENVSKARTMITNIIIGIVAFGLLYAFLQWLIPGGIFG